MTQDVAVDLVLRLETVLDHPVEKVWPYILHWNLWVDNKDFISHRVAGKSDTEGEVIGVNHFDDTGRMDSSFFIKVLKIVPNKLLIYKILSPESSYDAETGSITEVPQTGYEVFSVCAKGGTTMITLDVLAELRLADTAADQARGIAEKYQVETERNWYQKYFPKLKQLLSRP
jgi:uncharacterized protein YndB with AHSA1/START domain